MFLSIPKSASGLSPSALHLLVMIVARVPSGSEVNMTQQDLSVATKASRSTVQRALLELQEVGMVEIIHRGSKPPVLVLPWRQSEPLDEAKSKETVVLSVDARLSSIEDRLSTLESKQTVLDQDNHRKNAVKSTSSKEASSEASTKAAKETLVSKEASNDALKRPAKSEASKRREQQIRALKPKAGPEAKVTDQEVVELARQHGDGLTRTTVVQAFQVGEQAAKRYLKRAYDAGFLRVEGQSGARRYFVADNGT